MASNVIKKDREIEAIDKASHPYLYENVVIIRNGDVVSIDIRGLKDIPVGVDTTIFTLPLDYRPLNTDRVYDLVIPSSSGNVGSLRVKVRTSGNVDVHVYYVVTSDHINNAQNILTFAI